MERGIYYKYIAIYKYGIMAAGFLVLLSVLPFLALRPSCFRSGVAGRVASGGVVVPWIDRGGDCFGGLRLSGWRAAVVWIGSGLWFWRFAFVGSGCGRWGWRRDRSGIGARVPCWAVGLSGFSWPGWDRIGGGFSGFPGIGTGRSFFVQFDEARKKFFSLMKKAERRRRG